MHDVFVGRQPIYGRDLELYAYELLYRGGMVDAADFVEGDRATSEVLLNTFTELGLERVVGRYPAFVNLTRGFVIGEYPLPVPRERVVLEVLEDVPPDPEVLLGLRRLRRKGFKIALDDFVLASRREALLDLADIVKVDIQELGLHRLEEEVRGLRACGVALLAEKVETRAEFERCRELDFTYFQGYFLARPNVVQGTSIPASKLNLLRLLADVQSPHCDFDRIQEIVRQDVTLSYKLLRHINAAVFGMPRRIDSIRETVVYLGLETVRNLASLFVLSNVEDTPHDLVVTSILRARMCELLAQAAGFQETHGFFTTGLFSALDVLMSAPMPAVLARLPLGEEIRSALLRRAGPAGEALNSAIAYEHGDWEGVGCFGLSRGEIKAAFLEAVTWVERVEDELRGVAA